MDKNGNVYKFYDKPVCVNEQVWASTGNCEFLYTIKDPTDWEQSLRELI